MKNLALVTLPVLFFGACSTDDKTLDNSECVLTMEYPIVGTNQTLSFNDREIISIYMMVYHFTGRTPIIRAIRMYNYVRLVRNAETN